jgi:prepilin-type N-terminal cleavage/methylation domain-containing protein
MLERPQQRAVKRGPGGFTLLEIMVALAILAMTLVVLLQIITNNVRASNHSKMTTAATFLARGKMIDIEDDIIAKGFVDNDETASGDFKEQGFATYRWESAVERVELPTDLTQKAQQQSSDTALDSKDPMAALGGMIGGLMSSFLEPIRIGLQESVRRVTVRVFWDESGRPNQTLEVVTFLTDPAKLDLALTGGAPGAPGAAGAAGAAPGAKPSAGASAPGTVRAP